MNTNYFLLHCWISVSLITTCLLIVRTFVLFNPLGLCNNISTGPGSSLDLSYHWLISNYFSGWFTNYFIHETWIISEFLSMPHNLPGQLWLILVCQKLSVFALLLYMFYEMLVAVKILFYLNFLPFLPFLWFGGIVPTWASIAIVILSTWYHIRMAFNTMNRTTANISSTLFCSSMLR